MTVTSVDKIHGSGNLGVEVGGVLLFITPSNSLGQSVLPVSATLGSVGLEDLVLR